MVKAAEICETSDKKQTMKKSRTTFRYYNKQCRNIHVLLAINKHLNQAAL